MSPTTCSTTCARKRAKDQRRAAEKAALYVEPVSWKRLAERDGLTCYLCGIVCDPTDYDYVMGRDGRRAFRAGPTHPSHDHVVAVANGGEHSMDNARLACMACNSHKAAA